MSIDPQNFWDQKILSWEDGRYLGQGGSGGLENVANKASSSLRSRMEMAFEILAPRVPGKRILELGCGSGLLATRLLEAGARSYAGFDFSSKAIERAKSLNPSNGASFDVMNVDALPPQDVDIVFSLGLLDWLTDHQIRKVFTCAPRADFLHSFSENKNSVATLVHRAYCYLSYGYRTKGYIPRYHREHEIMDLCDARGHIVRDPKLSFGAFVLSFKAEP